MSLELVIAGVALFVACVALVYAKDLNEQAKWLERDLRRQQEELRRQQEQIWAIQAGLRELGMELVKPKPPVAAKWVKREFNREFPNWGSK